MRTWRYAVETVIYPHGPNDPVTQRFEITLQAGDERAAETQAAQIGFAFNIMLLGPL